jgi:hypothetical protein
VRIILDTNVFISWIFFSGPPSQILKAWKNQKLQIVLSKQILDEYQRVAIEITPIIELVTIQCRFIDIIRFLCMNLYNFGKLFWNQRCPVLGFRRYNDKR